jgi:hypothetical protein
MFVIAGVLGILIGLGGYSLHTIRNVETILPDYPIKVQSAPKGDT